MKLKVDVVTIFPELYPGPLGHSVVGRALRNGILDVHAVDLRSFAHDRRGTVDDKPYGGGPGMLMKVEPLVEAVESLRRPESVVLLATPRGERFTQRMAEELAQASHLVIVCGHYEGVDERAAELLQWREVSIGDYVLSSGNLPAMVIVDAVARLLPGVLGSDESSEDESFSAGLLEYPQYTRPPEYRGLKVPEVLLSGDHGEIARWRRAEAARITGQRRPDLCGGAADPGCAES